MRQPLVSLALVSAVLAAPIPAALAAEPEAEAPGLSLTDRFPVAGRATTIRVPPGADEVEVIYSPGSKIARTGTISVDKLTPPKPGKPYQVVWRPERPGVVQLSAGGEEIKASVRFDGVPLSGIAILILAGLILFGGAAVSLRALVSER